MLGAISQGGPPGVLYNPGRPAAISSWVASDEGDAGLRDFLYLDADRIRSLLAQLDGGVVEQVIEKATTGGQAQAGGRVFGLFDLRGSLSRERASEQTKTLQDALYLIFEEAASRQGLLAEIEELGDPAAWQDGSLHEQLREGQLLSCHAPTRILDARLFRERAHRFVEWSEVAQRLEESEQKAAEEREEPAATEPDRDAPGEEDLAFIKDIGDLYGLLMADQISVRQFPCGVDRPELSLSGTLLARPEFLQEEREALFGKYGSALSKWTVVSQVATLPQPEQPAPGMPEEPAEDQGASRRFFFEALAVYGMRTFEEQGFVEAPAFPGVHVTPLAVYREVPVAGEERR